MKTISTIFFTFTICSIIIINTSYSQFEPDVRLTNTPVNTNKAYNNGFSVAGTGNFVHVVFYDNRSAPNNDVFYKRSTDNGLTWEPDIQLTNQPSGQVFPTVLFSGSVVHVFWQDHQIGGGKTYYRRSADFGVTWSPEVQVSLGLDTYSEYPSAAVSGNTLHVVYQDQRGGSEIFYRRSTDAGLTWETEMRLTNSDSVSVSPSVSASGMSVHVAWVDGRDGNREIYYKNSTDDGASWNADTRLTTDTMVSNYPSISSFGSNVVVVWQDNRDSGFDIFSKRSVDGGITWASDNQLTTSLTNSFYPSVTLYGSNAHVVWSDVRNDNWEIYYKLSYDAGLNWKGDKRLTESDLDSYYPSIAVTDSAVHVVWQDSRDGNFEIYYKRDPSGNFVKVINMGTEIPEAYSLSQNYPNPFNPSTRFEFRIADFGFVKLVIYDNLGREIETPVDENMKPGTYEVTWNASGFSSGVYYYKLTAGDYTDTKKMILLK